ncbi:MAG: autotransporter-associated beta strand repeat-containing protein, partial [Chthoniobacterales bacterium]
FYNGIVDATTTARLSVASGSVAAFNVGGTGEFTSPQLDTILGNGNFAAGSVLGLDTTSSSGGTFAHAGTIGGGIGLAKLGTGTLVLSGGNSYTGATTVGDGTLQFAKTSAFYGGVIDSTTAAKLSLASGSTVTFNIGGAGEFTGAQINTVRTGGGFLSGSFLGLDTTNAIGGVADYGTTGMVGSHGLIKSGSGTLMLRAFNNYSGLTKVLEGALHFATYSSLYTGSGNNVSKLTVASGATATFSVGTGQTDFNASRLPVIFENAHFELGSTLGLHTNTDFTYDGVISGAFTLRKFGGNTLTLSAVNSYAGGSLITGGTLQLGVDDALGSGNPAVTVDGGTLALGSFRQRVGAFILDSGSVTGLGTSTVFGTLTAESFDVRSGSISANLAGSGSLTKSGLGTVVLTGANSYAGATSISGGTLVKANHDAMGTGAVVVEGGVFLIENGITAGNAVILSGGEYDRALASNANLAHAVNATSSFAGGKPDTNAMILEGVLTSGTTLQTSFANTSSALNDEIRLSDVYSFHGTGTDIFVLQLSMTSVGAGSYLGWLNDSNEWVNAVLGNTGENQVLFVNDAFDGNLVLGHYGVDTTTGSVWAVINHNSDFAAVVPEPSIWALLAVGLGLFLGRRLSTTCR